MILGRPIEGTPGSACPSPPQMKKNGFLCKLVSVQNKPTNCLCTFCQLLKRAAAKENCKPVSMSHSSRAAEAMNSHETLAHSIPENKVKQVCGCARCFLQCSSPKMEAHRCRTTRAQFLGKIAVSTRRKVLVFVLIARCLRASKAPQVLW